MIVDPDFVDHWKTRMLVDLLGGDEVAPVYVIRLWAHCQQRREWRFDPLPTAALKAICRYQGDGKQFEEAMLAAGFVTRDGEILTAVGWDEYNATLIANWANGKKGGRPKKEKKNPSDNTVETHGLSTGSPRQTQGVTHEEPIRLDERREEKKEKTYTSVPDVAFEKFWEIWPNTDRKAAKAKCREKWAKAGLEVKADEIISHVTTMKAVNQSWRQGFEPAPLTYLNQRRWEDGTTEKAPETRFEN